jgi:dihydrofolate reductase
MISDDPVSQGLNFRTKHVASRSRSSLEWETAELLKDDVPDAVRALKAQDGGELQVHGSPGLIQTLLAENLIDELRLIVFPVTIGQGKRLFGEGTIPRSWRLTAHAVSASGAVMLTYENAGEVETGRIGPEYEGD